MEDPDIAVADILDHCIHAFDDGRGTTFYADFPGTRYRSYATRPEAVAAIVAAVRAGQRARAEKAARFP